MVVGIVLVSDLFLTSHAYLKDGAVCIHGAFTANRIHSRTAGGKDEPRKLKAAVNAALAQARLAPKDVQVLEEVGSTQDARKALKDLSSKSGSPTKSQTLSTGTTGFASLCGLGE